jgi:hypothetical protein
VKRQDDIVGACVLHIGKIRKIFYKASSFCKVLLRLEKDKSLHTQFLFAATGCC